MLYFVLIMGFSLGIVGLPNVGKSTLFNALSRAKAEVSNYPFCTIDPNVGVVEVPDERLYMVQKIIGAPKAIPTVIEFTDIAGLVKGAHKGEGLGNQFLSHIREVDAIAHVVRCFKSEGTVHVEGEVDPARDIEIITLELILADLAVVEKKLSEVKAKAKAGGEKLLKEVDDLQKLREALARGIPARKAGIATELSLLTSKPVLYVANIDESGNKDELAVIQKIAEDEKAKVVPICAKIEAEILELSPEEAKELGYEEAALPQLIRAGYELLNLITFFTANNKESRAWTAEKGTPAPKAVGKIHSDMEKGFIAADVIHYDDLVAAGAYNKVKEKGMLHTEGKNYLIQDGDLILVKFNV